MNRQDKLRERMRQLSLFRKQKEKRENKQDPSGVGDSTMKGYVEEALKNGMNGMDHSDIG